MSPSPEICSLGWACELDWVHVALYVIFFFTSFHPLSHFPPLHGTNLTMALSHYALWWDQLFWSQLLLLPQYLCQVSPAAVLLQRYMKFEWGTSILWNQPSLREYKLYCWCWWQHGFPLASLKVCHQKKSAFSQRACYKVHRLLEWFLSPNEL